ncbi:MAG TPA: Vms1/Ankzf1 family peptidyl-tRNA hydrolase, partial [Micromonosporaceae bacterium]|nr:Vms1/Ankzf1 family peptidyl-tRNA hydrolase [Micromonosporaceae bacterium]
RLGADLPTVHAVGEYLDGQPYQTTELAIFAADGAVHYTRSIPRGVPVDRIRYSAPANVAPLLAWSARQPAYVLVVTDRTGADVTEVPAGCADGRTFVVTGPDDEIERNAPGGWSQPRFQRRAEDSWQHNASAVAARVVSALRCSGARLLLVAGDVRAVQLLRDYLPLGLRRDVTVVHLPGGRSPNGSGPLRAAACRQAIQEYVATLSAGLLARFADARGPSGTTVEGAQATLAALAAGRLSSLLVSDDPADHREAWFGPDMLAAPDIAPRSAGGLHRGWLVDVAVRAAVLTDAEVHILDRRDAAEIAEGIGGLARF